MATRIYVVGTTPAEPGSLSPGEIAKRVHLVRAATQAQAIRHVVRNTYSATVATQDMLVDLMTVGVRVEEAGEENLE